MMITVPLCDYFSSCLFPVAASDCPAHHIPACHQPVTSLSQKCWKCYSLSITTSRLGGVGRGWDVCLSDSKALWGLETETPIPPRPRERRLPVVRPVLGAVSGDRMQVLLGSLQPSQLHEAELRGLLGGGCAIWALYLPAL